MTTISVDLIKTIDDEDDDNHSDEPPKNEPNEALICYTGNEIGTVLAHKGRFFYWQDYAVGPYGGLDEYGINLPPEDEPGFWVLENCNRPWSSTDWETGIVDDFGVDGQYRRPTKQDFIKFGREDLIECCFLKEE